MSDDESSAPTALSMSIEIGLPFFDDELQDAIADDLCNESNLDRLRNRITQWARLITGHACHVEITVD